MGAEQVVPDARTHENLADPGDFPEGPEHLAPRFKGPFEAGTIKAGAIPAGPLILPLPAEHAVHVRCRPTCILDHTLPSGKTGHHPHLPRQGFTAPALNDAPLVAGKSAESAVSETPPVSDDRKPHWFEGRDSFPVGGVLGAGKGKFIQ